MFQACRPTGRLFYWVLAVVVVTASSALVSARAEVSVAKPRAALALPRAASPGPQGGPELTNVVDTVYMADGKCRRGRVSHHLAGVCCGGWDGGGSGVIERDFGNERCIERGAHPERGGGSSEHVLHGGVPAGAE